MLAACAMSAAAVLLLLPSDGRAASLDPSFGNDGTVVYNTGSTNGASFAEYAGQPHALTLDKQGRILVGGGSDASLLLLRYLPGGSLDPSFGDGGVVSLYESLGGGDPKYIARRVEAVKVLPGGKIIVVWLERAPRQPVTRILRLLPDGTIDHSFSGPRGKQAAISRIPAALALLGGGGMLVGGRTDRPLSTNEKPQAGYITKYDARGNRMSSFGAAHNGSVSFASKRRKWTSGISSLIPLGSGKILASGYQGNRFLLARLLANGRLDRTFGPKRHRGRVLFSYTHAGGWGLLGGFAARGQGGKIVQVGYPKFFKAGKPDHLILVRRHADGTLDRTFGKAGSVDLKVSPLVTPQSVAIQRNGRILVALSKGFLKESILALFRFLPNGRLDKSFFGDGRYFAKPGDAVSTADRVVIDPKQRAVLAGGAADFEEGSTSEIGGGSFVLKRFLLGHG
jgi:uncharacterized delta-60 repeat protein